MKRLVLLMALWLPALPSFATNDDKPPPPSLHLRDAGMFRFELDNDIFFGSDNQFSNGWNFRIHSPVYNSWEQAKDSPKWVRTFGNRFPSLLGDKLYYRTGFSVGQVINTPSNILTNELVENDVPYVGLLAGQITWTAYNEQQLRSFGATLGTIGRSSLSEQSQNIIHEVTGSDLAQGWDNQLSDELAFNISYVRKKKFFSYQSDGILAFDAALAGGIALGNIFTLAESSLEFRLGRNLPRGFSIMPEIAGRTIGYDATLSPINKDRHSIYTTVSLGVSYYFHHLLVDGSLFSENHGEWVDSYPWSGLTTLGFHYETPNWATRLHWVLTTETVDIDRLANDEDKKNRFLSITLEWGID